MTSPLTGDKKRSLFTKRKTDLIPQNFMNRVEKLNKMVLPSTNSKRIIIRSNNAAMGFRFDSYDVSLLKDRVDKATYDKTVFQANKICERNYLKKRKEETSEYFMGLRYTLYISLLLIIVAIILFSLRFYHGYSKEFFYAGMLVLFVVGGIAFIITMLLLFINPKFTEIDKKITKELKEFLTYENANTYLPKLLRWSVEPQFFWLELWLLNPTESDTSPPTKSPTKGKRAFIISSEEK